MFAREEERLDVQIEVWGDIGFVNEGNRLVNWTLSVEKDVLGCVSRAAIGCSPTLFGCELEQGVIRCFFQSNPEICALKYELRLGSIF